MPSDLYRKRRAYAERTRKPWFIVSAVHKLVEPDRLLTPNGLYLKDLDRRERRQWGEQGAASLEEHLGLLRGMTLEVRAGADYLYRLRALLIARGATVYYPIQSLRPGEQK